MPYKEEQESHLELLPEFKGSLPKKPRWRRYVLDTWLALGGILLLTSLISLFHLYERIPDSLLLYLLVVLALASTRGRYASLLAALVAFFAFDFLFVPPLYSLIVTKFDDFLTLIVFLLTAIITSQLTAALRRYAAQARLRERETRILYNLLSATNREENIDRQLSIFVQSVVEIFAPWGMLDCLLLLPDPVGKTLRSIQSARSEPGVTVPASEIELASRIMLDGQTVDLPAGSAMQPSLIRLVPLQTDQKVLGVLRLHLAQAARHTSVAESLGVEYGPATPQAVFFRMFLEEAVALLERGRLQRESLRIQVLQQTDTLRAALLSSVSHDLRTPLAAIMAAASSLYHQEMHLDEETRQSMAMLIEQEARRLNRLVENLLDMSRIEAGALRPKKIWYPLGELIRDVLGRMYLLLQGRPLLLSLPEDLPAINLDYMQIDQVMTNLLENAARYTPASSPLDISVEVEIMAIKVNVADRGPGIPAEERELIFDKFYRVQRKMDTQEPARGSGLGLAVCRGLVEAHGGRIWVEPRPQGGAVFCFTLPRSNTEELKSDE